MILQNRSSLRVDCDPITGKQKKFNINYQSQNTRSGTETRCQQKLCSEKNIMSKSCCRAQQRLVNLTTKSKIKDLQQKLLDEKSCRENLVDPKPPFICKVQNYEHINALKTKGKLNSAIVLHNGCYEYYPKDPVTDREFTFNKQILNDNAKVNEKCIKEKNNAPQTFDNDLHSSSTMNVKKSYIYKNNSKIENAMGANEKTKPFDAFEYDTSCAVDNNSKTSEKSGMRWSTLKSSQRWFDFDEPEVSKVYTGNMEIIMNKPLKISEALELHEKENQSNLADGTDYIIYNNGIKKTVFPSSDNYVKKFENLKISELHDTFSVETLNNPMESSRNICSNKTDRINHAPAEVLRIDDTNPEFLSYDDSPKFTDFSKNCSSAADHDTLRGRNCSNGYKRFSISSRNLKTDNIQKNSSINTFTKSRNFDYNCNHSRSSCSTDYSTDTNNNSFNGLTNKYPVEKINYPIPTSIGCSEYLLSSQNSSFSTSKRNFSEKADVLRNSKGIKHSFNGNYPEESDKFKKDKQFVTKSDNIISRRDLSSQVLNDNEKRFSCQPVTKYPEMKKKLNSKAFPSISDSNDLSQSSTHNFLTWDGFQQKQQHKVPEDISRYGPSQKNLLKEYDTTRQQALKYAKSCSDFTKLSRKYSAVRDTTQTSSCLAQQRLLSCKRLA